MARWGIALVSSVLAVMVLALVAFMGWRPFEHPGPWLAFEPLHAHLYSLCIGLAFGSLLVMTTPALVARLAAVRALHQALRPIARGMSPAAIGVVSVTSALAEEILFRGLLLPHIGLTAQAILFGLLHYAPSRRAWEPARAQPGPDERAWRWAWVVWASMVGLAFGVLFQGTGSLAGPIAAHALVNWLNLRYLRRHDPEPPRRALGGLLGQRG
jgi:membrane protease YdiL (CAAX protease family)